MGLLKKAVFETAYAKIGSLGFPGSGKTHTACAIAIGLAQLPSAQGRPVAFFDTETGSDFWIQRFQEAGVDLMVVKSRAFRDLLGAVREAEQTCSALIIDSISHVWQELTEAYKKQLKRKFLRIDDWGTLKGEWAQFTTLYLNSKLHIVLCGRAGYEYEQEKDEETGKTELYKVGTKMKAETDMGYEPSLLFEMVRVKRSEITRDVNDRGWLHKAVVLKDRFNVINGQEFDNPTFESFLPHISRLNLGGEHVAIDPTRSSVGMFETPESAFQRKFRVEVTLENITNSLIEAQIGGTSKDAKEQQVKHLKAAFGTASWTAIQNLRVEDMEAGLHKLRANLLLEPLVEPEDGDLPPAPAPTPEAGLTLVP